MLTYATSHLVLVPLLAVVAIPLTLLVGFVGFLIAGRDGFVAGMLIACVPVAFVIWKALGWFDRVLLRRRHRLRGRRS